MDSSNQSESHPMSEQKKSKSDQMISMSTLRGMVTGVLVLAFISGGVAGALVPGAIQYFEGSGTTLTGRDTLFSLPSTKTVVVEETSATDTVEKATDSVVSIIIEKKQSQTVANNNLINPFFGFNIPGFNVEPEYPVQDDLPEQEKPEDEYVQVGGGTGFVVSEYGLILTNRHVVNDADARYSIVTRTGETYELEILGKDPVNDLALVKTKEKVDLHPLELGDSDSIKIGQTVLAIGNSLGEFSNTVTKGVISGIDRTVTASDGAGRSEVIETAIQTDAAINPGNSGGPLLNLSGQVLAVNTAVSQQGQLIGFAIPINEAKRLIKSIQENGRVVRPYVGVRYVIVTEALAKKNNLSVDYGALLRRGDDPADLAVIPGGPADKAGLEENDIILEVNGEKIKEGSSLGRILGKYNPNDTVTMKVLSNGDEKLVKVTLGEFEPESN